MVKKSLRLNILEIELRSYFSNKRVCAILLFLIFTSTNVKANQIEDTLPTILNFILNDTVVDDPLPIDGFGAECVKLQENENFYVDFNGENDAFIFPVFNNDDCSGRIANVLARRLIYAPLGIAQANAICLANTQLNENQRINIVTPSIFTDNIFECEIQLFIVVDQN